LIGIFIPYSIPEQYSSYVAVAILAALDSVFGGIVSTIQKKFDMGIFLSGFFGNALLAAALTYIGTSLEYKFISLRYLLLETDCF